jgi:putative transposase
LLTEGQRRYQIALWGYCLMSNHWHLVVEVEQMAQLSSWVHWVCNRHVRLYHRAHRKLGGGHIYQGRFKSFPIQDEVYLHEVLRYVEANPVRAGLVSRGRDWPWSSLSPDKVTHGLVEAERPHLQPWPRNGHWEADVGRPLLAEPLELIRQSVVRSTPYGYPDWVRSLVARQGLETTVRMRGRPKKLPCLE